MNAENGDLTKDGAGLISLSKAKKLALIFELHETPSAFQIQCSGLKGWSQGPAIMISNWKERASFWENSRKMLNWCQKIFYCEVSKVLQSLPE